MLGLWALAGLTGDALMVDIGGTSTDLAIMADGAPLMTFEGLHIAGRPTLVRSFLTHSLALGGDSVLSIQDGRLKIGPSREGPALSLRPAELGRRGPTLTDALNVLGLCRVGDEEVSRQGLEKLSPAPANETAALALNTALSSLGQAITEFLDRINNRPVYTLGQIRLARTIKPRQLALLGGPAPSLAGAVSDFLKQDVLVPPEASVANAVGAASARPALSAELYADTALGILSIPALGFSRSIPRNYNLKQAEAELLKRLGEVLDARAARPQIVEAETFNQLAGFGRSDKIFRLRAQAAPGLLQAGSSI